jgi:hypothetical protein
MCGELLRNRTADDSAANDYNISLIYDSISLSMCSRGPAPRRPSESKFWAARLQYLRIHLAFDIRTLQAEQPINFREPLCWRFAIARALLWLGPGIPHFLFDLPCSRLLV